MINKGSASHRASNMVKTDSADATPPAYEEPPCENPDDIPLNSDFAATLHFLSLEARAKLADNKWMLHYEAEKKERVAEVLATVQTEIPAKCATLGILQHRLIFDGLAYTSLPEISTGNLFKDKKTCCLLYNIKLCEEVLAELQKCGLKCSDPELISSKGERLAQWRDIYKAEEYYHAQGPKNANLLQRVPSRIAIVVSWNHVAPKMRLPEAAILENSPLERFDQAMVELQNAAQATNTTAPLDVATEEQQDETLNALEAKIHSQIELVKVIKQAKAPATVIKPQTDKLIALKAKLLMATLSSHVNMQNERQAECNNVQQVWR